MKRRENNRNFGQKEHLQILVINLKRNYHTLKRLFWNFEYQDVQEVPETFNAKQLPMKREIER